MSATEAATAMDVEEDDVPTTLTEQFELAKELQATDIDRAISKYREIMRFFTLIMYTIISTIIYK